MVFTTAREALSRTKIKARASFLMLLLQPTYLEASVRNLLKHVRGIAFIVTVYCKKSNGKCLLGVSNARTCPEIARLCQHLPSLRQNRLVLHVLFLTTCSQICRQDINLISPNDIRPGGLFLAKHSESENYRNN